MANAVSWIINALLLPPPAGFNSIKRQGTSSSLVLGFGALANLDYTLQYRSDLTLGSWLLWQEFGSSPADRSLSVTSTISGGSRFFRLGLGP
jgi:hypothetical protein